MPRSRGRPRGQIALGNPRPKGQALEKSQNPDVYCVGGLSPGLHGTLQAAPSPHRPAGHSVHPGLWAPGPHGLSPSVLSPSWPVAPKEKDPDLADTGASRSAILRTALGLQGQSAVVPTVPQTRAERPRPGTYPLKAPPHTAPSWAGTQPLSLWAWSSACSRLGVSLAPATSTK